MQKQKILIVDDDAEIRDGLSEILSHEGYDVVLAGNGEQGLRLMDSSRPDLVLLDLRMPNLSGEEFLTRAQQYHDLPRTPVVIMSAGVPNRDELASAIHFLQKPMEIDTLCEVVKKYTEARVGQPLSESPRCP